MTKKILAFALVVLVAVSALALPSVLVSAADETIVVNKVVYDAYVKELATGAKSFKFIFNNSTVEWADVNPDQQLDIEAFVRTKFASNDYEITRVEKVSDTEYRVTTSEYFSVTLRYPEIGTTSEADWSTSFKEETIITKFASGVSQADVFKEVNKKKAPYFPGKVFAYWKVVEGFTGAGVLASNATFEAYYYGSGDGVEVKYYVPDTEKLKELSFDDVDPDKSPVTETSIVDALAKGTYVDNFGESAFNEAKERESANLGLKKFHIDRSINPRNVTPATNGSAIGFKISSTDVKTELLSDAAELKTFKVPGSIEVHKTKEEGGEQVPDKKITLKFAGWKEKAKNEYVAMYKKDSTSAVAEMIYKFKFEDRYFKGEKAPVIADKKSTLITSDYTKILDAADIKAIKDALKEQYSFVDFEARSTVVGTVEFTAKIKEIPQIVWYEFNKDAKPTKVTSYTDDYPLNRVVVEAKGHQFLRWEYDSLNKSYNAVYRVGEAVKPVVLPDAKNDDASFAFAGTIDNKPAYNKTSTLRLTAGKSTFKWSTEVPVVNTALKVKFLGVGCKVEAGKMTDAKKGTPVKVTWNKKGAATVIAFVTYKGESYIKTYDATVK